MYLVSCCPQMSVDYLRSFAKTNLSVLVLCTRAILYQVKYSCVYLICYNYSIPLSDFLNLDIRRVVVCYCLFVPVILLLYLSMLSLIKIEKIFQVADVNVFTFVSCFFIFIFFINSPAVCSFCSFYRGFVLEKKKKKRNSRKPPSLTRYLSILSIHLFYSISFFILIYVVLSLLQFSLLLVHWTRQKH